MSDVKIKGYADHIPETKQLVNVIKEEEERVLRMIDSLQALDDAFIDKRALAVSKTNMQTAWMWMVRSVFQPQRISLPEDDEE